MRAQLRLGVGRRIVLIFGVRPPVAAMVEESRDQLLEPVLAAALTDQGF